MLLADTGIVSHAVTVLETHGEDAAVVLAALTTLRALTRANASVVMLATSATGIPWVLYTIRRHVLPGGVIPAAPSAEGGACDAATTKLAAAGVAVLANVASGLGGSSFLDDAQSMECLDTGRKRLCLWRGGGAFCFWYGGVVAVVFVLCPCTVALSALSVCWRQGLASLVVRAPLPAVVAVLGQCGESAEVARIACFFFRYFGASRQPLVVQRGGLAAMVNILRRHAASGAPRQPLPTSS